YWGPRGAAPETDDFPGEGTGRDGAAGAPPGTREGTAGGGAACAVTTVPQDPHVNFCPASKEETSNFARHLGQSWYLTMGSSPEGGFLFGRRAEGASARKRSTGGSGHVPVRDPKESPHYASTRCGPPR